jgi:hypothetical protein
MRAMNGAPYTTDTSSEAYAIQLHRFREMAPAERILTACRLSQQARRMAIQAIRRLHPSADERAVKLKMIEIAYGRSLAEEVSRWQAARCE